MFLIQIALTLAIVHIIASNQLRVALSPAAILTGRTKEFPRATAIVALGSFWLSAISGLAGIWTFAP